MSDTAIAEISRQSAFGMLTLRADLAAPEVGKALAAIGVKMPAPLRVTDVGTTRAVWMSPDEVLIVAPIASIAGIERQLNDELAGVHAMVVDVSDARAVFSVKGTDARDVLAKGAPVDLSSAAFGANMVRRTRLGQVAVAFWVDDADKFTLICFRSVADFVETWLVAAANRGAVGFLN